MKKLFIFVLGIILFCSCGEIKREDAYAVKTEINEYLNINGCRYYKIKVGVHDAYQYKFSTYTGTGSDIIHFNDMCDFCKENINK